MLRLSAPPVGPGGFGDSALAFLARDPRSPAFADSPQVWLLSSFTWTSV